MPVVFGITGVRPNIGGRWSKRYDELLLSLVWKNGPPTEDDVEELSPSWTPSSVQQRYHVFQRQQEEGKGRKNVSGVLDVSTRK